MFSLKARRGCYKNFRQKDAYEPRASGINPENDELNQTLAEIADRMAEFEKLWSEEKEQANKKAELEAFQAEEVRRKATERLGQTMDMLSQKENRKRRSSTEALEIVNESLKVKKQHLERDLELRRQELEERRRQADETRQFQQIQMQWMQQLQQQQTMEAQQQHNMQMMMSAMELIKNLNR
eukprot:gene1867-2108_t